MAVQRFRTKTVEVEAVKFTGDNYAELQEWTGDQFFHVIADDRGDDPECIAQVYDILHSTWIGVKKGQWIVRGIKGEFYPCDDETFHWKYSEVHEDRPAGILIKKETIFEVTMESDEMAYFTTDEEEPRVITMSQQDWNDFGQPDQITVTIEPGDKLNDSTPKATNED